MKKIFKVIVGCVIVILTLKACRLNYVCDVVDSIPKEIRERIITEHPECANIDLLVKFWETLKEIPLFLKLFRNKYMTVNLPSI